MREDQLTLYCSLIKKTIENAKKETSNPVVGKILMTKDLKKIMINLKQS